jgi:ankyrin repeat protein
VRLAAIVLLALSWSTAALCSPIQKAIKKGDIDQVKAMVEADPSLISKKYGLLGDTLLSIAAGDCKIEVVKLLLDEHAEVDAKDHLGLTPLFEAAGSGCADVAQVLLVHGANPNAKNKSGETVMWWANNSKSSTVADVLRLFGGR